MNFESLLKKQHEELLVHFPGLYKFSKYKRGYSIRGSLDLVDPDNGKVWDVYEVRILVSPNYPRTIPTLIETGKKIERIDDLHIDENGVCCLAPRVEEFLILGYQYNLADFIKKLVIPFLANQKLISLGEKSWNIGEYSHFGQGVLEYYKEKLGISSMEHVLSCIRYLSGSYKLGRNDPCFCNGDKKFKDCHQKKLYLFSKIDKNIFAQDLKDIEKTLE